MIDPESAKRLLQFFELLYEWDKRLKEREQDLIDTDLIDDTPQK